ncbi:MAG: tripartite tricarboxylate transporter substrate binding protein [Betaproteobacteria bacterium]|nr:MAG: tripartite tricarboxylate transporter substrate binding protein [Betaproteobacteria bacterium]
MSRSAAIFLACIAAAGAQAQNYPNKPVRVVVAAATGGPDIVARVVGAQLQQQLGQPFVIENQPGANGIVGAQIVAKAAPDGYTLLVYSSGFVINPFVYKSLPYDTEKDFTPVTNLVSNGGLFFAVANSIPAKNMQEFLEYAKKPGTQLAYSTPGVGNTWHLAMEVFDNLTGIKMTHIPYKGGGPATAALAAGEVQAMFASPPPLMPHYKSGRVRVLAFTGEKRHPAAPEIATMAEQGINYKHDGGWFAMFAPAGTPPEIVDKLWREVHKAMQDPGVRDRLVKIGAEPVADSPADFKKFVQAELKAYAEQARLAGIKPE